MCNGAFVRPAFMGAILLVGALLMPVTRAFSHSTVVTKTRLQSSHVKPMAQQMGSQRSRRYFIQNGRGIAVGIVALPSFAGAITINPKTGFPEGSCLDDGNPLDPENGCTPFTNTASILDKQYAVLAGKIIVGANKAPLLVSAIEAMKFDSKGKPLKKEKIKLDKDYVLRFSALYFTPLKNSMEAYCERDANGAKAAGGAGLPKFTPRRQDILPAAASPLYSYVMKAEKAISDLNIAAFKGDFTGATRATYEIQKAAQNLVIKAQPRPILN